MDVVEGELLFVQHRGSADAGEFPRGDVAEVLVVASGFALFGLILLPEVAAAALVAVQGVDAHQLAEFEEVGHAAGLLEGLVELLVLAQHPDRLPELLA